MCTRESLAAGVHGSEGGAGLRVLGGVARACPACPACAAKLPQGCGQGCQDRGVALPLHRTPPSCPPWNYSLARGCQSSSLLSVALHLGSTCREAELFSNEVEDAATALKALPKDPELLDALAQVAGKSLGMSS